MKTLRWKFILFAMAAVSILLLLLIISLNGLNWYFTKTRDEIMMNMLVQSEGKFMFMDFHMKPQNRGPFQLTQITMDQMRSVRFFIAEVDGSGDIDYVNIDEIFSVTEEQARIYAEKIYKSGSTAGLIDNFRYAVKRTDDDTLIFFMDTTRQKENFLLILWVSVAIAAVCWLIVLVSVYLISGKVVRPIIAGMEKQKRFITDAGHELKTPLAIIQSNNDANILINGENKYSRNIRSQVRRLSDLTSNLLMLAKLDEEVKIPLGPVNISDLADEILPAYQDTAESMGFTLTSAIEKEITANSNRESLTKLMTILLDNALKYTTKNGMIRFELKKMSGWILITEENSCEPGSTGNPEQLFERFYRGDSARTQQNEKSGYGIGLSIAKMICENMGGSLNAEYPEHGLIRFTAKLKA